ncbi:MAG: LytTR family transcriptional regulator [Bacteroidia bacterium]|nr:LytTR family transcriptional regulator [Bacteroidia bacterium]
MNKAGKAKENADAKIRLRNFLINNKNISISNKMAIQTREGFELIAIKDFIRFEADGKYTWCFLVNGEKILSTKNLKEFEDLLSDYNFLRVHHSHLVNMEHIQYYHKGEGGIIVMSNHDRVVVSKRQKEAFLERLNRF